MGACVPVGRHGFRETGEETNRKGASLGKGFLACAKSSGDFDIMRAVGMYGCANTGMATTGFNRSVFTSRVGDITWGGCG